MTDPDPNNPFYRLADGRGVWLVPLTFGRARIVVGKVGEYFYDDGW